MDVNNLLYLVLVGVASGFIGASIMKGRGLGFVGNLIVGIVGSILGGWLLNTLGFYAGNGLVPALIKGVIGSVVLLFVVGLIRKS